MIDDQVWAAVITGSAALLGVIGGGFISIYTARTTERRREASEADKHRQESRRLAYAKYLAAVARMTILCQDGQKPDPSLQADWLCAQAEVELVGSKDASEAAKAFSAAVSDQLFSNVPDLPVEEWGKRRRAFVNLVRTELAKDDSID